MNYMKIADSVLVSLYMKDNEKSATSLRPLSTSLSGTQFSTLKRVGINHPEE
jgi:hypothetical protein